MATNTEEHCGSTAADAAHERSQTTLHDTCTNQDATNRRRHKRAGYTGRIPRQDHRQQRNGTHTNRADHEAATTTAHQQHHSCSHHLTVNRPHASRPTPNQPGVHGSKRKRRPTGWQHRGAPRPPTTMPTNKTGLYHHATDQPTLTNHTATAPYDRATGHIDLLRTPGPPGERKLDRVRRCECAPGHASPVARACSSRLTPTENQPRWGCLQDRAFGLAPGPWAPESGG